MGLQGNNKNEVEDEANLGDIRSRSNKVAEESLESTRRMVQLCDEAKEAGIRTLVALDDQGEQLEHAEEGLDNVNSDMKIAEKNLSGMTKCCGLCTMPWDRDADFKENSKTWNKNHDDGAVVTQQPTRLMERDASIMQQGFIVRIANNAREDEMDENIVQMTSMVGNLRNMAVDMGSEIENQNRQIGRINAKAESNEIRIAAANRVTVKMLK